MFVRAKLNEQVFDDPLTPEACYWVGFLLADGCHSVKHGKYRDYPYIILALARKDVAHLTKWRDFLQCNYNITDINRSSNFGFNAMSSLSVYGDHLLSRLSELGIVKNKTKIAAVATSELENSLDFWRGFIDGDGSVSMVKNRHLFYPAIMAGGTSSVITSFARFLKQHFNFAPKIGECRGLKKIGLNGTKAQVLVRALYYPGCVALDRKLVTAQRILRWKKLQARGPRAGKTVDIR